MLINLLHSRIDQNVDIMQEWFYELLFYQVAFELEEALRGTEFVRASRQELVNLDYVTGISPAGSGRILLSLSEKNLVASRKYASDIKKRIGIL